MIPVDPTRRAFLKRLLGATASASVLPAVAGSAVSPSSLAIIESAAAPLVPLVEGATFLGYAALRRAAFRHMDRLGVDYREGMRLALAAPVDPPLALDPAADVP